MLGLRFCARAFSSCSERGPLFIAVRGPLLLRSTGSRCAGSVVVAHGPSCSAACGIFPDQGWNPCPLHWQADSQPLRHQGSPPPHFPFKVTSSILSTLFVTVILVVFIPSIFPPNVFHLSNIFISLFPFLIWILPSYFFETCFFFMSSFI